MANVPVMVVRTRTRGVRRARIVLAVLSRVSRFVPLGLEARIVTWALEGIVAEAQVDGGPWVRVMQVEVEGDSVLGDDD